MGSCKFTSICFIGIVFKSTLNRVFKPYQTNVSCSARSLITRKPKNEMSKRSKKIGNTDHFKDTFSKKRCPMVTQHQVAEIKYRILAVPDKHNSARQWITYTYQCIYGMSDSTETFPFKYIFLRQGSYR